MFVTVQNGVTVCVPKSTIITVLDDGIIGNTVIRTYTKEYFNELFIDYNDVKNKAMLKW
jgi:hypothetical protein